MKKIVNYAFLLLCIACNKPTNSWREPMPQPPKYDSAECWYTNVME